MSDKILHLTLTPIQTTALRLIIRFQRAKAMRRAFEAVQREHLSVYEGVAWALDHEDALMGLETALMIAQSNGSGEWFTRALLGMANDPAHGEVAVHIFEQHRDALLAYVGDEISGFGHLTPEQLAGIQQVNEQREGLIMAIKSAGPCSDGGLGTNPLAVQRQPTGLQ